MRGYVGGSHVGVSAGVPGPKAAMGLLQTLVWIAFVIPYVTIVVLIFLVRLLGPPVWWLTRLIGAVLMVVTWPIWAPFRGVIRHRRNVKDRKALQRVASRHLLPAPPAAERQFGSTRG